MIGSLALTACDIAFDLASYEHRYRLTVEVQAPEGLKTGSSVIQVNKLTASTVRTKLKGEAVVVDLGKRGTMFALLRSDRDNGWAGRIVQMLVTDPRDGSDIEDRLEAVARDRKKRVVPRYFGKEFGKPISAYPMLVTFEDLDEPTSVTRVDPDDLATSFGEGVSLKRITVQVTDDAVTTGIEEKLGWAEKLWPNKLNGDRFEDFDKPELAARLSPNSFSTEIGQ
jgi:hypothetical protein